MKKLLLALILFLLPTFAFAQSNRNPCVYIPNKGCISVGYALNGVGYIPMPVGGIANASAPTFVEGIPGYLSFDLAGNLRVITTGGSTQATNITQIAGNNIAAGAANGVLPVDALSGSALLAAVQAPLPTQASTISIGGVGVIPNTSSTIALTDVVCGSAVSNCVLKGSQGNFYGVYAECTSACWLMVFNSVSAPSNGPTTAGKASGNMVDCIELPKINTTWQGSLNYPTFPINLNVGITAAISSTACGTLTLSTVGFIHGTVM